MQKEQNRKKCDQLQDVFDFVLLMYVVCLDHWVVNRRDCARHYLAINILQCHTISSIMYLDWKF